MSRFSFSQKVSDHCCPVIKLLEFRTLHEEIPSWREVSYHPGNLSLNWRLFLSLCRSLSLPTSLFLWQGSVGCEMRMKEKTILISSIQKHSLLIIHPSLKLPLPWSVSLSLSLSLSYSLGEILSLTLPVSSMCPENILMNVPFFPGICFTFPGIKLNGIITFYPWLKIPLCSPHSRCNSLSLLWRKKLSALRSYQVRVYCLEVEQYLFLTRTSSSWQELLLLLFQ